MVDHSELVAQLAREMARQRDAIFKALVLRFMPEWALNQMIATRSADILPFFGLRLEVEVHPMDYETMKHKEVLKAYQWDRLAMVVTLNG